MYYILFLPLRVVVFCFPLEVRAAFPPENRHRPASPFATPVSRQVGRPRVQFFWSPLFLRACLDTTPPLTFSPLCSSSPDAPSVRFFPNLSLRPLVAVLMGFFYFKSKIPLGKKWCSPNPPSPLPGRKVVGSSFCLGRSLQRSASQV